MCIKNDRFAYLSTRFAEKVGNHCAIVYTDFIHNVGKIVSALFEAGVDSVAYHGEMDVKSRDESYLRWR